jgi:hypothetical protein
MCAPIPKGKWSWKFDKCVRCGTTKIKHKGRGLCLKCFDKDRDKNDRRRQVKKKAHNKWYLKVKDTPDYKKYSVDRAKIWRDNSQAYPVFLKREQMKLKFRRFIKNRKDGKGYTKHKEGIEYICNGCVKHCKVRSCVKPVTSYMIRELEYFKREQIKMCSDKI